MISQSLSLRTLSSPLINNLFSHHRSMQTVFNQTKATKACSISTYQSAKSIVRRQKKPCGFLSLTLTATAFAIGCSQFSTNAAARPLLSSLSSPPYNFLCLLQQTTGFRYLLNSPTQLSFCRQFSTSKMAELPSGKLAPGWDPVAKPFPSTHRSNDSKVYKSAKEGEVKVEKPYSWLEIPPSESKETKEWVTAQAAFTDAYAKGCTDREEMKNRLQVNLDYARFSSPSRTGRGEGQTGNYYYSYNSGLDPQATYYQASNDDLLQAENNNYATPPGRKWFDQNLLSKDGTVAISSLAYSKSGKYVAYGISKSGSDWSTIYFRETSKPFVDPAADEKSASTGGSDRLDDVLEYLKYSHPVWTHDDAGVFYMRFPEPSSKKSKSASEDATEADHGTSTDASQHAALYYHKMGTSQKDDILVIARDEKVVTSMFSAGVSSDGKWLIISHSVDTDTKSRTYVASMDQPIGPNMKWICLVPKFEYQLSYMINKDNDFYFISNKDAPNSKIVRVRVDPAQAKTVHHITEMEEEAKYEDVVKEDKASPIRDVTIVNNDKLLIVYSRDVKDELWQYELQTGERLRRLLPDFVGTINAVNGRWLDDEAFVTAASFINPGIVTRLTWSPNSDAKAEPKTKLHRTVNVKGIDPSLYESKQVFVKSKDGTKVPVFLTHRKDTKLDGTAPAWLYFYGGFGISLNPSFSASLMTWITAYGGVLVWVNARGGAEYGDAWHDAGRLLNKQNTFDDVLSVADYLVSEKVAAKGKIIVNGGSNGGMGAMAVGNQAPEGLLGGVVAEVGVHDMLRFMHFTAGKYWVADYGNPEEDPAMFDYVYKYSPLHSVNASKIYPTVLLMSGDHDDRVSPLHTFKMAAELQHRLPKNPNPILARLELKAGHGAGKSTQKVIEEAVDKFCITARSLSLTMKPLPKALKANQ